MTYFKNVTSFEELKKQYRALATTNHPDVGGTTEVMQVINSEYDMLFPVWKIKNKITSTETAYSTRSEFYTQNGWKGENYNSSLRTKEITKILRDAIKIMYPLCKFSVSFDSYSGGSSINISLMEAPYSVFVSEEAITKHYIDGTTKVSKHIQMNHFYLENESRITEQCRAMFEDINALVKSYRYDDSDSMIDYFHTNFYYDLNIGRWNKEFEVVEKTARIGQKANCKDKGVVLSEHQRTVTQQYTYDIKQDVDTRDNRQLFVVKISEKLSKEEYYSVNATMKSHGGYYSKFKHGFIFKEDPSNWIHSNADVVDRPNTQEPKKQAEPATAKTDNNKLVEKINKQIENAQKKIDALAGDHLCNTYKRMREQESRDQKILSYRFDIDVLTYLLDTIEVRWLTKLELALMVDSFRTDIDGYYRRNNLYNSDKRPSAAMPIKYPEISGNAAEWYNAEVPKKQKRLNKADIYNTPQLLNAVEEYGIIVDTAAKPVDQTQMKIKKLERECIMMQKGDINFTPPEVAKHMVELARIDGESVVLEPSAGIARIADEIKAITPNVDVVEQMSNFRELLILKGYNLVCDDFMQYTTDKLYDAVIANPPFSEEETHIKQMYGLLKPGGTLVTICSPHWSFAQDRKAVEFKSWVEDMDGYTTDLPSGTFEMTGVASKILVIEKKAS